MCQSANAPRYHICIHTLVDAMRTEQIRWSILLYYTLYYTFFFAECATRYPLLRKMKRCGHRIGVNRAFTTMPELFDHAHLGRWAMNRCTKYTQLHTVCANIVRAQQTMCGRIGPAIVIACINSLHDSIKMSKHVEQIYVIIYVERHPQGN